MRGISGDNKKNVKLKAEKLVSGKGTAVVTRPQLSDFSAGIKILAIGNSFSEDTTRYLPEMLKSLGVADVKIVNLFSAGCPLPSRT